MVLSPTRGALQKPKKIWGPCQSLLCHCAACSVYSIPCVAATRAGYGSTKTAVTVEIDRQDCDGVRQDADVRVVAPSHAASHLGLDATAGEGEVPQNFGAPVMLSSVVALGGVPFRPPPPQLPLRRPPCTVRIPILRPPPHPRPRIPHTRSRRIPSLARIR